MSLFSGLHAGSWYSKDHDKSVLYSLGAINPEYIWAYTRDRLRSNLLRLKGGRQENPCTPGVLPI